MNLRTIIVAVGGVGAVGLAAWVIPTQLLVDDSATEYLQAHRLNPTDYATISFPRTAPPRGALVSVSSNGNPVADGQGVSFQYSSFTIRACTYQTERAARDACAPQQDMRVFRQIDNDKYRTLYSISAKADDDEPSQEGTSAEQFFTTTDVTTKPTWLTEYATKEIQELTE